jgi:hypothetical protein
MPMRIRERRNAAIEAFIEGGKTNNCSNVITLLNKSCFIRR